MLVTQSWSPGRQVFVPGTAEVLARHPVGEDPVPGDTLPLQGQMPALRVLVGAGYTGVTVHAVHGMLLGMAGRGLSFFRDTAEGIRHPPQGRQPCGVLPEMGRGPEPDAKNTLFPSFLPTDGKSVFFVMSYEKSRLGRRENAACGRKRVRFGEDQGRKRVCFFVFLTNLVFKLSFLQEKVAKFLS